MVVVFSEDNFSRTRTVDLEDAQAACLLSAPSEESCLAVLRPNLPTSASRIAVRVLTQGGWCEKMNLAKSIGSVNAPGGSSIE